MGKAAEQFAAILHELNIIIKQRDSAARRTREAYVALCNTNKTDANYQTLKKAVDDAKKAEDQKRKEVQEHLNTLYQLQEEVLAERKNNE